MVMTYKLCGTFGQILQSLFSRRSHLFERRVFYETPRGGGDINPLLQRDHGHLQQKVTAIIDLKFNDGGYFLLR